MAWNVNGKPDTLSGAGDDLDVSDMIAVKFNQFMTNVLYDSSSIVYSRFTFNDNGNSVYASRYSYNGGTDTVANTQPNSSTIYQTLDTAGEEAFVIMNTCSISGEEKLSIYFNIDNDAGVGAGFAPNRREGVFKFVPSPDAGITSIEFDNLGGGNYATSTNLSALGTD